MSHYGDTDETFPLPDYSNESSIFDLYELLENWHSGQWDPIYAVQSRRDPENVYYTELVEIRRLLGSIIAIPEIRKKQQVFIVTEAEYQDIETSEAWLPTIDKLVRDNANTVWRIYKRSKK